MKRFYLLALSITLVLCSCAKEEPPIDIPRPPETGVTEPAKPDTPPPPPQELAYVFSDPVAQSEDLVMYSEPLMRHASTITNFYKYVELSEAEEFLNSLDLIMGCDDIVVDKTDNYNKHVYNVSDATTVTMCVTKDEGQCVELVSTDMQVSDFINDYLGLTVPQNMVSAMLQEAEGHEYFTVMVGDPDTSDIVYLTKDDDGLHITALRQITAVGVPGAPVIQEPPSTPTTSTSSQGTTSGSSKYKYVPYPFYALTGIANNYKEYSESLKRSSTSITKAITGTTGKDAYDILDKVDSIMGDDALLSYNYTTNSYEHRYELSSDATLTVNIREKQVSNIRLISHDMQAAKLISDYTGLTVSQDRIDAMIKEVEDYSTYEIHIVDPTTQDTITFHKGTDGTYVGALRFIDD